MMGKIKNNTWGVLALIILVIIVAVVSSSEGYERGYAKSQQEFQQYKDDNYIYYDEWGVSEEFRNRDLSSEYITYEHTVFGAYRKDDYYYSIDFRNYEKDVGFDLWYNIDRGVCGLRVIDLVSENYESTEYKSGGIDNGNS